MVSTSEYVDIAYTSHVTDDLLVIGSENKEACLAQV
jgi:hypothetical protein